MKYFQKTLDKSKIDCYNNVNIENAISQRAVGGERQ